jgi:hypothetical protein
MGSATLFTETMRIAWEMVSGNRLLLVFMTFCCVTRSNFFDLYRVFPRFRSRNHRVHRIWRGKRDAFYENHAYSVGNRIRQSIILSVFTTFCRVSRSNFFDLYRFSPGFIQGTTDFTAYSMGNATLFTTTTRIAWEIVSDGRLYCRCLKRFVAFHVQTSVICIGFSPVFIQGTTDFTAYSMKTRRFLRQPRV